MLIKALTLINCKKSIFFFSCYFENQYSNKSRRRHAELHFILHSGLAQPH